MNGKLYLVSTPIGNLKDISLRAIETLKDVDIIACEDTRHSLVLLNEYDIHKKLIVYNKDNERNSADGIINLLQAGKNIALISDAGMPIISDPGNILVKKLIENQIDYTIIPGANAGLCALALSGFDNTSFSFFGFLNDNTKIKRNQLEDIKKQNHTCILYASRHNINKDLDLLYSNLGERKICIAGELTKMYEKVYFGKLSDFRIEEPKGEYVLIIEGGTETIPDISIQDLYNQFIDQGQDKKSAMKSTASALKIPKNQVYKELLK